MTATLFFVGVLQCAILYFLGKAGKKLTERAQKNIALAGRQPSRGWPRVALIVPLAGERPGMEEALKSLLGQDYPDFTPIFVTASEEDPACRLIRDLRAQYPLLQHVVAGRAETCGQKNRNLLAAVEACGNFPAAYVFCDSTHVAREDFLRCLLAPLANGEAAVCTGYHLVIPGDHSIVTLAYAQCVLLMRFLQAVSSFTQPWGGALAISREAFERYGVASLWAENVVDDCSLGALLLREGAHIHLCPAALMLTRAAAHPLPVWRAWLERQILFLKFCMPGQWLCLGLFAAIVAAPPIWCAWACLEGIFGDGTGTAPFLALCWLCLIGWVMARWRAFLPSPPVLGRWLWAFFFSSLMFALVWLCTVGKKSIFWQNCLYQVGKNGRIKSVRRY